MATAHLSRRGFLRIGGLTVSIGALAAACGDRGGDESPGLIGDNPTTTSLPPGTVDDAVLMRTASSLEFTAMDVYASAAGLDVLGGAGTFVDRFVADHASHAARFGELTEAAGGTAWECANPWLTERAITPILAHITGDEAAGIAPSDDPARDVLSLSYALETLAGAAYQALVPLLDDPALRAAVMEIGAQEVRHAAVVAMRTTGAPDGYLSPALDGDEVLPDDAGFIANYAIPSQFGQLAPFTLIVGARDANGTRWKINLETPAPNSFVYGYIEPAC